MKQQYVKLNGKVRVDKKIYTKEQIKSYNFGDYGRLIPLGYIIFDFDDSNHAKIMLKIVKSLNLKCKILYTSRGLHFMFKTNFDKVKNVNKQINFIGLQCDTKGLGTQEANKIAYQAIKVNRKKRKEEFINCSSYEEIDIAPKWLYYVPNKKEQLDLTVNHEGKRNELFFATLKNRAKKYGFSYDEYVEQAHIINNYVLPKGIPEEELEHAIRKDSWKDYIIESRKKIFSIISEEVIKHWNCLWADGQIAFFNENINRYDTREVVLKGYLQQKYKNQNMTINNMTEVFEQMKIQLENDITLHRERNNEYILCGEQLVSMLKNEIIPNTRNIYTDIYYPYTIMSQQELENYEKKQKLGYHFLNDISCGEEILKQAICECLGCMLAPTNHFQKMFILYGTGSNGKSALLQIMQKIMGNLLTNTNILKINERFALSKTYKGIANITDDVGITTIKETGLLKSIISGNTIEVERKNRDPINWTPTSQFVIACNQIPKIQDTSKGMLRRLAFIPFKMQLDSSSIDIDMPAKLLGISIKLPEDERNDNVLRYIMTKAILAYREAYKNGRLTEISEQKRLLEIFEEENQGDIKAFYNWLLERESGIEGLQKWIDKKSLFEVFVEYTKFLGYNSPEEVKNITQRAFLVNFNKLLPKNIQRKNITINGHTIKIYVVH